MIILIRSLIIFPAYQTCHNTQKLQRNSTYCTVSLGLNLPMTRFRFTLISELYLGGSEGRATRKVNLSSAWPRDQLNSAQTILALLGITVSFPLRAKNAWEYRKMLARRGARFVPIGMPTVFWKTFRQKPRKYCKLETQHIDDVIFRVLVFRFRAFLHKICFFVSLYQIFVSTVTVFENEGVSDNTGESVYQFLVRYCCI